MSGCSKVIFEKNDLSQNEYAGLTLSNSTNCIVRDNKISGLGENLKPGDPSEGAGLTVKDGSTHNQVLRNAVIRCKWHGISVDSSGGASPTDNTFQSNDVSWTASGIGFAMDSGAEDKVLDNTAGYCKVGFHFMKCNGMTLALQVSLPHTTHRPYSGRRHNIRARCAPTQ